MQQPTMFGKNTLILITFSALSLVQARLSPRELRLSFLYPLTGKTEGITESLPFGSAFTVALDVINNNTDDLLPFTKLTFLWNDTQSLETVALKAMAEHYFEGIDAFIGPGDENDCITAARMAAAWNIPMVSYFCTKDAVSNKSIFPTFARTRPPNAQSSKSLLAILKRFDWRMVAILYCNPVLCNGMEWLRAKKDMKNLFSANGITVSYENILPMEHEKNKTSFILKEIKRKGRIIILSASISYVQSFLVAAQRNGMTNGQYVYIINELTYEYLSFHSRDEWWEGMSGLHKDLAEKAFHSVLALVPRPYNRTKYTRFEKQVTEKLKEYPFNAKEEQQIALYYSAYLYDAVYLYALAVNKTIAQGLDPKDGTVVFRNIRETSYQSITGFEVRVDKNGDAEFNMTLFGLQKNEREENEMLEVGQLFIDANGSQTLELHKNKTLTWSDTGQTRVPADSPVCGFSQELCPTVKPTPEKDDKLTYLIVTLVICSALIVTVTVLLAILYRKRKFEKELTKLTWKVNYHEIKFHPPTWKSSRTRSFSAAFSASSFYGYSSPQLRNSQVGRYKATPVYVKKFERLQVEISRNELLELKQIYELHHGNLANFVGACVEPPNFYTLTEFCSRGSIQDIVMDDNIKLDSMFIRSLVADIVEGMLFLHSSELKVHGNLKSSNCLVDGRWVLKITDFGPSFLKQHPETTTANELLWTAPEILRSEGESSTQKGDVYSFAIILQEMETRAPPFYEYCLDVEEIIDLVKETKPNNPFRPKVAPASKFDDLCMLMTSCWSEDPDDRPTFREIKRVLLTLQGGKKENIVDKVIYLLEDYSSHLEELVRERTEQWIEEKKKTEELLHSMLPKSVADQLIAGSPVKADYFEEVSIFFSDIVGFTPFCSSSSPLQIVIFLNDLYTLFDSVIADYDVYKVETIGDAYMVASGLPIRNGHEHARHIADMALDLLRAQDKFVIRHKPKEKLKLRIGIHSGAVCAGVVGLRMPRYCLFGDAVNMASRMESTGEELKIHLSKEAKSYLDRFDGYDITVRGTTLIKGKGEVVTYWLNGRLPRDQMTCASARATRIENITGEDDFVSH